MESRFIQLANTQMSDEEFFEEVFIRYIEYLYHPKRTFVQDLSRIRQGFNQNDPHTHRHLRDNIEAVLYRYNNLKRETSNADMIEIKRNIDRLEEKLEKLIARLG